MSKFDNTARTLTYYMLSEQQEAKTGLKSLHLRNFVFYKYLSFIFSYFNNSYHLGSVLLDKSPAGRKKNRFSCTP